MPSNPDSPSEPGIPTSHVELAKVLLNIHKTRIADLPDLSVVHDFEQLRPWYTEKDKLRKYILEQVKNFCLDIQNPEPSLEAMRNKGWLDEKDFELARKQIESLRDNPGIQAIQSLTNGCATQDIRGGGPTQDIHI